MDIEELTAIEIEEEVVFKLKPGGKIGVKGEGPAIDRALARIDRAEVAALLRERDGSPEEIVEREIALNVPSKAAQRDNYVMWFGAKSDYYKPSEADDVMFSKGDEGDEILPDFAHSFTCRKPDGRLIQIDRKGRITPPSPYTPHRPAVQKGK
jgi:hypothetical protein